jgi:hypothetical protein
MSEIQTINEIINTVSVQWVWNRSFPRAFRPFHGTADVKRQMWLLHEENGWKKVHHIGESESELAALAIEGKGIASHIAEINRFWKSPTAGTGRKPERTFLVVPYATRIALSECFCWCARRRSLVARHAQKRVSAVCDQLGMYIVNAQLFEKISRFNEQLNSSSSAHHGTAGDQPQTGIHAGRTAEHQAQVLITSVWLAWDPAGVVAHESTAPSALSTRRWKPHEKPAHDAQFAALHFGHRKRLASARLSDHAGTASPRKPDNGLFFHGAQPRAHPPDDRTSDRTQNGNARQLARKLVESGTDRTVENFLNE